MQINNVSIANGLLSLEVDGQLVNSALNKLSVILANVDETTLGIYEISPSGYGIH